MAKSAKEELMARIETMSEEDHARVLRMVSRLPRTLPPSTPINEVFKFSGIWGEDDGREIQEIIERDCERIAEE